MAKKRAKIIKMTQPAAAVPPPRTAKQYAHAYMMGQLEPKDYPMRGGLRGWMMMADEPGLSIAKDNAITKLSKLADLDHEVNDVGIMEIKLIGIKNDGADNAVRIDSA